MKRKSPEQYQIQVGAFLTVGIILAMTLILVLGSNHTFFQQQYELVSRFDDISGLRTGAPVQLAGVNVGFVEKISFSSNIKKKKVKVHMRINKDFQERIRQDSEATVVTQGLLGDRMIFISVGSADKEILKDGDAIRAGQATGFAALVEKSEDLMREAKKVMSTTDKFVANLGEISKEIIDGDGLVHAVVYNPDGKIMVQNLSQMSNHLNAVSRNLASIAGKVDNGTGTLGALVNDISLFYDVKTLLGKANRNKLIRSVIRYTLKTKDESQTQ
jgi:phospholipid/cholesterol/gamma-HCH transport system substrate-binding protein